MAPPLLAYAARRLLQAVPLVFVIVLINFFLIHAAPGDPIDFLLGSSEATEEYIAQVRAEFGLDQPLLAQLLAYLGKVVRLDLGYSLRFREDVLVLILSRLPATLLLMGSALVVASVLGILLGALAARRPYSATDNAATLVALAGYSMPVFWLGQIMLLVFSLHLAMFPTQGMMSLRAPREGIGMVMDVAHHLVLPVATYSVYHLALVFRLTRVKMQETLALDFITTARAKGLPERRVVYGHALRNAMLPVVTVIGLNFGFMLAGSVLTETVFAWPGLGLYITNALFSADMAAVMGGTIVVGAVFVGLNMLSDVLYRLVDPRAR
jgi:peptide/nickel transport system permease protein